MVINIHVMFTQSYELNNALSEEHPVYQPVHEK